LLQAGLDVVIFGCGSLIGSGSGRIAMEKTNKSLAYFTLLFSCYPHMVVAY